MQLFAQLAIVALVAAPVASFAHNHDAKAPTAPAAAAATPAPAAAPAEAAHPADHGDKMAAAPKKGKKKAGKKDEAPAAAAAPAAPAAAPAEGAKH